MTVEALFFDIDDTLYSTGEFVDVARKNAIEAMIAAGLTAPAEEIRTELDEVTAEFGPNYKHHYETLLTRLPRRYYKGLNPAVLAAAGVVSYHATKARELYAYEDVIDVLRMLARTPIVRGIITAGPAVKQAEKLIRLGVLAFLSPNAIFISEQVGINKPNPKLFQRACSDLNLRPAACMYVGDHPVHDIDPANQIGMISVWNRRAGRHLAERGRTPPRHEIQNFWDLLEILQEQYGIQVPPAAPETS